MSASAFTLARWFQIPESLAKPEHKFDREDLMADLYAFDAFGVFPDGEVIVRGKRGTALLKREEVQGCPVVTIDYVENRRWRRVHTWFNASSMSHFGDALRAAPGKRTSAEDLFLGVVGGAA